MSFRWVLLERSHLARYASATAIAAVAALGHWAMFPYTAGRIPFLLFLPGIILATAYAGRGPGLLVIAAGALNASLQLVPVGSPAVALFADRLTLAAYGLTALFLVVVGHQLRMYSKRDYADLEELHELSAALVPISDLETQLDLVLRTLVRMHEADRGLVSLYSKETNTLRVAASLGFGSEALAELKNVRGGEGACGLACLESTRLVLEDVTREPGFAPFRELAAREGFRAAHSTPLISRDGQTLGAISVHFKDRRRPTKREMSLADICARKAAIAIERAAAEEAARESERRFRTVIEASTVPFIILEPVRNASAAIVDFRWNYVNAKAAYVLGHPPAELVGRNVLDVVPGTWDDPGLFEMYVASIERQTPCAREVKSEANGIAGWFQIIASPLEGKLAIWFTDITERKNQEEALRDADRRKDEFLATLAHELRNPLAPIRQATAIAASKRASEDQREWGFSVIQRQVEHMALLLDDLLDVSRITRGTLTLRKQTVDLRSIVSAAAETARPLIETRRHQLRLDVPEGVALVADPLRLSQILANLLTNAAKYTLPGGTIRLSAQVEGRIVCMRVEDNGIGLRPQDLPLIFQMFAQVRSTSDHAQGGLGIGLALTKGLVEMHSGSIEVMSAGPGKGATFIVRLPVGDLAQAKQPDADARTPQLVVSRRVLIADDNRDAAESLAILLQLDGHQVVIAGDGPSAIRLFDEHAPDVAILDVGMPGMSGYEVARCIRATPRGTTTLLVALTGWGQEKDRRESRAAGFDHHLTKPIEPAAVTELVARMPRVRAASN
jgi:PAS domain S-box-containing protein